jgi:hypothetical protein
MNTQGLIIEQRTYWDTADWARQIGIDPNLFAPKRTKKEKNALNPIAETTNTKPNPAPGADFVQALTAAFTSDDTEVYSLTFACRSAPFREDNSD